MIGLSQKFRESNANLSFQRNQEIRDLGQPLLLAKSRDREMRGGAAELVALIPELCYPTGLTEEMRQNVK